LLEGLPNVEAVVAPLSPYSPTYHFCFSYGHGNDAKLLEDLARDIQRKRIAEKAEQALQNTSGCARCEGVKAVVKSGGSGRITRALVRSVVEVDDGTQPSLTKKSEEKEKAERNLVQVKYRAMKSIPMEQRLAARRSHIHGWGLFTKVDIAKDDPVVEYSGEIIQKPVADKREQSYELSGEGSCYMFRLDLQRIVDATKIGCMARFMNHSCCPNAYATIISVETDNGQDRKIVVFALRDIDAGSEITYDYKFPVEDGSIRCTCGAPNCIGRLN
jgi:SET domain